MLFTPLSSLIAHFGQGFKCFWLGNEEYVFGGGLFFYVLKEKSWSHIIQCLSQCKVVNRVFNLFQVSSGRSVCPGTTDLNQCLGQGQGQDQLVCMLWWCRGNLQRTCKPATERPSPSRIQTHGPSCCDATAFITAAPRRLLLSPDVVSAQSDTVGNAWIFIFGWPFPSRLKTQLCECQIQLAAVFEIS